MRRVLGPGGRHANTCFVLWVGAGRHVKPMEIFYTLHPTPKPVASVRGPGGAGMQIHPFVWCCECTSVIIYILRGHLKPHGVGGARVPVYCIKPSFRPPATACKTKNIWLREHEPKLYCAYNGQQTCAFAYEIPDQLINHSPVFSFVASCTSLVVRKAGFHNTYEHPQTSESRRRKTAFNARVVPSRRRRA